MNKEKIIATLSDFKRSNKKRYFIRKIGFFGSAARGNMSELSDIDVVVELDRQDLFNIIGIKQDLEEQFHTRVDLVSYRDNMNNFLKNRIDKEAVYV